MQVIAQEQMASDAYRRELGDGLVLRWSTPEDIERVAALCAQVFRQGPEAPPNDRVPLWTRDMFSGRHPHITPHDFAVVEDTRSGDIVASTCLIRYTCTYEGIPFAFGRPEEVATLPEHRRKGLIRAIFELIHARSDARGDLVQGITGIPYFYRQFGYEYAVPIGDEGLVVYFPAIPPLKPGEPEPYTLSEATEDDVPLLARLWTRHTVGMAVTTIIEEDYWRWAMTGMHPDSMERWRPYVILEGNGQSDGGGRPVGGLVLTPGRWSVRVNVNGPVVEAGMPLVKVLPSVLRGVQALADTTRPIRPDTPPPGAVALRWGGPGLRSALGDIPSIESASPYPWYMRVADLPRFLRHIAPALERRLAESAQAGYSGESIVDFYRGGLRLAFEEGKLTAAENWQRPLWGEARSGFPPLVFLQALFGYRNLEDLRRIYPDVWAEGEAVALLETLFPKRQSLFQQLD